MSLKSAFSTRFKQEYAAFLAYFEEHGAPGKRERSALLLLICTMSVYFLQQQGLLDVQGQGRLNGDRKYLPNRLKMLQQLCGRGHFYAFYISLLLRLFQGKLEARQDAPEWEMLAGNIPHLNGHIFDLSELLSECGALHLPDEAFERLFGFFNEFEWCLDDRPLRHDKAISPDMIGYIFEKYSHQKQMGAYYTQEDITEYIGKSSIIPRLFDCVAQKCPDLLRPDGAVWTLLRTDPERYIYAAVRYGCESALPLEIEAGVSEITQRTRWSVPAPQEYALPEETWREVVVRRQRYAQIKADLVAGKMCSIDQLITSNLDLRQFAQDVILSTGQSDLLAAFYTSLEELTILDPTCGSGAFLLAALAILEPLYGVCLERMRQMLAEGARPGDEHDQLALRGFREVVEQSERYALRRFFIYRSIIANNLYGVDIVREATEICKLRLFLKSVAQIETCAEIESLAEIDFHIGAGNALVGFAAYHEISRIGEHNLGSLLFSRETLQQIIAQGQEVERRFAEFRQLQMESESQPGLLAAVQVHLRTLCGDLHNSLDRYLAEEYGIDSHNIPRKEEREERFTRWRAAFQPFHWLARCYEIMQSGGFDVIIGNPPYVAYRKVKDTYQVLLYETQTCGNLCAYVLERAATLLCQGGRCGMIVPVSTIASESYRPLSQLLRKKQLWISSYSNRPGKLFAGVEQRLAIILLCNEESQALLASAYRHWYEPEREHLFATLNYAVASTWEPTGMPLKSGSALAEAIFARLVQRQGFPLLNSGQPGAAVWVHNGPTYWVRALPFEPNAGQKNRRSDHYCKIPVASQATAFVVAAILSSSTFYFFYKLISNCRDLGQKELRLFPLGELQAASEARLEQSGRLLAQCLKDTAEQRTRRYTHAAMAYEVSYEEYYPARARALLNEIDCILAEHYGLSAEELDYVLHYDLKYRLPVAKTSREQSG